MGKQMPALNDRCDKLQEDTNGKRKSVMARPEKPKINVHGMDFGEARQRKYLHLLLECPRQAGGQADPEIDLSPIPPKRANSREHHPSLHRSVVLLPAKGAMTQHTR